MTFIADLHIHSRFSLATSKQLTVPHLSQWAMRKGIDVLGCGDFTHPKWRAELRQNLVYDEESGFYKNRCAIPETDINAPVRERKPPFFCLQAEISSIYKKKGKTRKIHNLVFAPTLEIADKISQRLALIGNLNSDGRPILGLDAHDLLEIVLECSEDAVLIPAHIWTPWFSLFGSKSGFDCIEDCFEDLTQHIFALETGLSSDPPMNRRLSALDKYAMISNSDAHSGANLGREANFFEGNASYAGMFTALRTSARREDASMLSCRFLGTLEFYPEEGKYHLDGHRNCNVVLQPQESNKLGNICPVCGKPLTIGVLHRVLELADRAAPGQPPLEPQTRMLVPLPEVVSQLLGSGVNTGKVQEKCAQLVAQLGPELHILCLTPIQIINECWPPLAEAVSNLRTGKVVVEPGFDGQYGHINVCDTPEKGWTDLPGTPKIPSLQEKYKSTLAHDSCQSLSGMSKHIEQEKFTLSEAQAKALAAGPGPVFVHAGPGAGKTRVLVARLLKLQSECKAQELLALTFSRRAAQEIKSRLQLSLPKDAYLPYCDTLHALAYGLLLENKQSPVFSGHSKIILLGEDVAKKFFCAANEGTDKKQLLRAWEELCVLREKNMAPQGELGFAAAKYQKYKNRDPSIQYVDYADLLEWLLANACHYQGRWQHILVDEAQDLSPIQLAIIRALLPSDGVGFFGIGDPNQAIYSFRGACADSLAWFQAAWPNLQIIHLAESYRTCQKILDMARTLLDSSKRLKKLQAIKKTEPELRIFHARDEKAEARWIAEKIKNLLGSTSHSLLDSGNTMEPLAPSDIAVLVRLKAQMPPLLKIFEAYGIPFEAPSDAEFWQDEQCIDFIELALRANTELPPGEFINFLQDSYPAFSPDGPFRQSKNFTDLCALWNQFGNWTSFTAQLAWLREAEMIGSKAKNVRVLTLHASKGLEFEAVFIPGMEDGILPLNRDRLLAIPADKKTAYNVDEEKRLLYVGLTRAAKSIYLSHCDKRMLYGRELALAPSPFLPWLDSYCLHTRRARKNTQSQELLSLFGEISINKKT